MKYRQILLSVQHIKSGCTSHVRGDLSLVGDGISSDGTTQEADLVEDLMVDGETYVTLPV